LEFVVSQAGCRKVRFAADYSSTRQTFANNFFAIGRAFPQLFKQNFSAIKVVICTDDFYFILVNKGF
jgi:hypothetical protein